MKDNDNIAKLFREKLSSHTEKVDPSVWKGVQANIGNAVGTASAGSSTLLTKVIIGVAAVTTIAVGTYIAYNSAETPTEKEQLVSQNDEPIEKAAENESTEDKEVAVTQEPTPEVKKEVKQDEIKEDLETDTPDAEELHVVVVPDTAPSEEYFEENTRQNQEPKEKTTLTSEEETEDEEDYDFTPINLQVTVDIHKNQYVKLYADAPEADYIYWELGNGDTTSGETVEYFYDEPGEYKIRVVASNEYKVKTEFITVNVEQSGKIVKTPNTFSPNNDGTNDLLSIESKGIVDFQITVLNDRQEVVYESSNPDFNWDGIHYRTNQKVPAGSYFYIIVAKDAVGNVINKHQKLTIFD